MSSPAHFEPRRVQQGLVCMLFDPKYAAKVRGAGELPELHARERELLRQVDPRALATDDMRRARAMRVLLDEYPVSAALVGLDFVDRFFASAHFRSCVFERGSMSHVFGSAYLRDRAKGIGLLETAMVHARRPLRAPAGATAPAPAGIERKPGVEALTVPEGTLAWYQRGRGRLGDEPLRALAKLRKPWPHKPPRRGREHLLIEAASDASLSISGASAPLVGLLCAASPGQTRAGLSAVAIDLGAESAEVDELLDDLLRDGLLVNA